MVSHWPGTPIQLGLLTSQTEESAYKQHWYMLWLLYLPFTLWVQSKMLHLDRYRTGRSTHLLPSFPSLKTILPLFHNLIT